MSATEVNVESVQEYKVTVGKEGNKDLPVAEIFPLDFVPMLRLSQQLQAAGVVFKVEDRVRKVYLTPWSATDAYKA